MLYFLLSTLVLTLYIDVVLSLSIWDRIPWNLSFNILMKIIFNCAGWINFRKLINTLYIFASLFTNWCFIINICIIPYAFPALFITYQNIIQNLFTMLIEIYFDQKTFWTIFEQHLWFHGIPWNLGNKTSISKEFHVILSRSKVPWNSMELFPYFRVPWNSMEIHGTFNSPPPPPPPPPPPQSSMEFNWTL